MVSTNYFNILGARPHCGRLFTPTDERQPGATPFVVLSHILAAPLQRRSGRRRPDAAVERQPFTVIGVAPEGFHGTTVLTTDVWVPVTMVGELTPRRSARRS